MKDVDKAFREAGVVYTLAYGTLIGAVRHKGFIPWDDDVDIIILYPDEKRLDDVMAHLPEGKYYLQKPFSTDWANSFYKLKLNGSTAIEESHLGTRMHQGLFIDIFVARRCPKPGIRRKLFFTLEYMRRGNRLLCFTNYGKPRRDWFQRILYWMFRCNLKMADMLCRDSDGYYHLDESQEGHQIIPKDMMEDYSDIGFEDGIFQAVTDYDGWLRIIYGDYMQLPPEEERVGSHLIAYDRNMDYTEWLAHHYKDGKVI